MLSPTSIHCFVCSELPHKACFLSQMPIFLGSFHHHLGHLPKPTPSLVHIIYIESHIRGIFIVQAVTAITDGRLCGSPVHSIQSKNGHFCFFFIPLPLFTTTTQLHSHFPLGRKKNKRTNQFPLTFLFGFQSLLFSFSPLVSFFVSIHLSSCWVCLSVARIDFRSHHFTAPQ